MHILDKTSIALSILQQHILAMDSNLDADMMFGPTFNMPSSSLEHAAQLLAEVMAELPHE